MDKILAKSTLNPLTRNGFSRFEHPIILITASNSHSHGFSLRLAKFSNQTFVNCGFADDKLAVPNGLMSSQNNLGKQRNNCFVYDIMRHVERI